MRLYLRDALRVSFSGGSLSTLLVYRPMQLDARPSDIRIYLQDELVRRCKKNPKYSLRAFAKVLGLESSALSKILAGKRSVSREMLKRFAQKLALSPKDLKTFEANLSETRGRPRAGEETPINAALNYQQLALDHFQIISEWYHFAILELTAIEGFQPSYAWVARTLGISVSEARAAVERLERMEMLEITDDGKWIDRAGNLTNIAAPDFSAAALRKMQTQFLAMAIDAIEGVSPELRDNTGMTMAIDRAKIPEAKKRIAKFRRELCAYLQSGKKDSVYQIGIALYPLSRDGE